MARISALLTERSTRHALPDRRCASAAEATRSTVAVQAQDAPASRLGLRARAAGLTDAGVVAAIEDERCIVRTWLMRGTIHLVHTDDLRWLVRLIGPAIERKYRTRWRQLGLSDDLRDRILGALPEILADGPRTRGEIRAALDEHGITVDSPDPQAHTHAVLHASTTGLLCRATDRGRDATFALLDDWVPSSPVGPSGDDALAELARRYFEAFSPATATDFASWSGLPSAHAIELIRDELTPVDIDGRPGYRWGTVDPVRGVRLLPAFDNYLLGYADREALLAKSMQDRVYQGGMIRATVVVDGAVAGTWSLRRTPPVWERRTPPVSERRTPPVSERRSPSAATLAVQPFGLLTKRVRRELEREAADIGRFLERPVTLDVADGG